MGEFLNCGLCCHLFSFVKRSYCFSFIDNEKSISHFNIALKLVCRKNLNMTLTFDLYDIILKFYHKIEFNDDTCTQNQT